MSRSYKRHPHYTTSRKSSKARRWEKRVTEKCVRQKLKDFENVPLKGRHFRKYSIAVCPDFHWKNFEDYYRCMVKQWYLHYHRGYPRLHRDTTSPPTREELWREYIKYYWTK